MMEETKDNASDIATVLAARAATVQEAYRKAVEEAQLAKDRRRAIFRSAMKAEGMTYGKLAKATGLPRGTVQSIVGRGK